MRLFKKGKIKKFGKYRTFYFNLLLIELSKLHISPMPIHKKHPIADNSIEANPMAKLLLMIIKDPSIDSAKKI